MKNNENSTNAANSTATYAIRAKYYYYAGTINRKPNGKLNKDGHVITFASRGAAQAYVAERERCEYILSHGEYSAPDYTIVKIS